MRISKRFYQSRRKGFTLIEVLLSLAITLLITTNTLSMYRLMKHVKEMKTYQEDIYIGVKQVSQYLIGSYYLDLNNGYHYVSREQKEFYLVYDQHRLVKKDGYEIIINNIDSVSFDLKNTMVYMTITRDQQSYRFLIGFARELEENNHEQIES